MRAALDLLVEVAGGGAKSRQQTDENGRDAHGEQRRNQRRLAADAITEVSEQRRTHRPREEREREERLTTIGRLLSGVIHDLKTPLTVISGYIQLMQHAEASELRSEYADLALKQFDHIGAMQRDILELARGDKRLLVRKVYLHKFFDELRQRHTTSASHPASKLHDWQPSPG